MPEAMAGAPVQHAENREAGEAGEKPETPETPDQGHACAARAGEPSPSVHQLRVADTPAGLLPPARGSSHPLVRGLETLLEPLATALSLWAVAGWQEGRVTPAWLLVSVLAFALCYPARPLLHVSPLPATLSLLAGWAWVAGLLLLVGMATGWLARLPATVMSMPWFCRMRWRRRTSARRGTLDNVSVPGVSSDTIISGKAAFLAPEIGMLPFSRLPPRMRIRSISSSPAVQAARESLPRTSNLPRFGR